MNLKLHQLIKQHPDHDYSGTVPFVFEPTRMDSPHLPSGKGVVLACPFPKFSIELAGDHSLTIAPPTDKIKVDTKCVQCTEVSPGEYDLVLFTRTSVYGVEEMTARRISKTTPPTEGFSAENMRSVYDSMVGLVNIYLERLQSQRSGQITTGKAKSKFTHPQTRQKATYKPSQVVYVTNAPRAAKSPPARTQAGQRITYLKSWDVRAHWRKLANPETYGLDRYGERTQPGWTWIGTHRKGEITPTSTTNKIYRVMT